MSHSDDDTLDTPACTVPTGDTTTDIKMLREAVLSRAKRCLTGTCRSCDPPAFVNHYVEPTTIAAIENDDHRALALASWKRIDLDCTVVQALIEAHRAIPFYGGLAFTRLEHHRAHPPGEAAYQRPRRRSAPRRWPAPPRDVPSPESLFAAFDIPLEPTPRATAPRKGKPGRRRT